MKKVLKVIGIILVLVIIIGAIFFAIDYNRVNNQKSPMFCIEWDIVSDGGTLIYLGLGYQVIDYNKGNGYDEIHIGTWFMEYDDTLKGCNMLEPFNDGLIEEDEKGYKSITSEDAKLELDKNSNIFLLDVRSQEEYDEGHIPNSMLMPVDELENLVLHEITDKNAKIFVYCAAGSRSEIACEKLVNLGYTNVYNLGGIIDWKYEIEK